MKIRFFHEEEKRFTVIVNGKEVTNPVAKVLITTGSLFFAVVVIAIILLVVLPIVGVIAPKSAMAHSSAPTAPWSHCGTTTTTGARRSATRSATPRLRPSRCA